MLDRTAQCSQRSSFRYQTQANRPLASRGKQGEGKGHRKFGHRSTNEKAQSGPLQQEVLGLRWPFPHLCEFCRYARDAVPNFLGQNSAPLLSGVGGVVTSGLKMPSSLQIKRLVVSTPRAL